MTPNDHHDPRLDAAFEALCPFATFLLYDDLIKVIENEEISSDEKLAIILEAVMNLRGDDAEQDEDTRELRGAGGQSGHDSGSDGLTSLQPPQRSQEDGDEHVGREVEQDY